MATSPGALHHKNDAPPGGEEARVGRVRESMNMRQREGLEWRLRVHELHEELQTLRVQEARSRERMRLHERERP